MTDRCKCVIIMYIKQVWLKEGMKMRIYTIIGGVNGVGKSSLSGVLSAENTDLGIIIDADKITEENGVDRIKGGRIAIQRIEN